jgi:cbb3-type cytochrome oxidase subunit 3
MLEAIYPHLKSLWTLWFFLLFAAIITWVMWPSKRKDWESRGQIPLRDGAPHNGIEKE